MELSVARRGGAALFRRIAVFAGGCTLDAAKQVCDAELDGIRSLVDKNLLRHQAGRYWMLETIREYAFEQLETQERDSRMRALANHLLQLEVMPYPPTVADSAGPSGRLADEADNFRAVAAWALAAREFELALRLAIAARRASAGGLPTGRADSVARSRPGREQGIFHRGRARMPFTLSEASIKSLATTRSLYGPSKRACGSTATPRRPRFGRDAHRSGYALATKALTNALDRIKTKPSTWPRERHTREASTAVSMPWVNSS